jgi:hypothetical protein
MKGILAGDGYIGDTMDIKDNASFPVSIMVISGRRTCTFVSLKSRCSGHNASGDLLKARLSKIGTKSYLGKSR